MTSAAPLGARSDHQVGSYDQPTHEVAPGTGSGKIHLLERRCRRRTHILQGLINFWTPCMSVSQILSVCLSTHLYIQSVCLSPSLYVCLPVCMSVSQSVCLSPSLYVCLPVCMSVSQSVCLSPSLYVCLPVCMSVSSVCRLPICLSVCLPVRPSPSRPVRPVCPVRHSLTHSRTHSLTHSRVRLVTFRFL